MNSTYLSLPAQSKQAEQMNHRNSASLGNFKNSFWDEDFSAHSFMY